MKARLKKLLWVALAGVALIIIAVHTSPVESLVLRKVQAALANVGFDLEAEKLDIHLFGPGATLKNTTLKGPGVDVAVEHIMVNGRLGLLLGKLSFDHLEVGPGKVALTPPPPRDKPPKEGTFEMPPIKLGKAVLRQVNFSYGDHKSHLDIAVDDFGLTYEKHVFETNFQTQAANLAGRQVPPIKIKLTGRTLDFRNLEGIDLGLLTQESSISLRGDLGFDVEPRLRLNVLLGQDLFAELPNTGLKLTLEQQNVSIDADTVLPFLGMDHLTTVKSEFRYKPDGQTEIPLRVKMGDLADLNIDLQLQDDLDGSFSADLTPATMTKLIPQLRAIESTTATGTLSVPELNFGQFTAGAQIKIRGTPNLDIEAQWRDGQLFFNGSGQPVPNGHMDLSGGLKEGMVSIDWATHLSDFSEINYYHDLPESLCGGPVRGQGKIRIQGGKVYFNQTEADLQSFGYGGFLEQDLALRVDGPLDLLDGDVYRLDHDGPESLARFQLNLLEQHFEKLCIDARDLPLSFHNDFPLTVQVQASGSGPLAMPNLQGQTSGLLAHNQGRFETPFTIQDGNLKTWDMLGRTAHASISGGATLMLNETLDTSLDVQVQVQPDETFEPIFDLALPEAQLNLTGTRSHVNGNLHVPGGQHFQVDKSAVPLDSDLDVDMVIIPPDPRINGNADRWQVAGIDLSDIDMSLSDRRIGFRTDFVLRNANLLRETFSEFWPKELNIQQAQGRFSLRAQDDLSKQQFVVSRLDLEGTWDDAPFTTTDAAISYGETISVTPFQASFAGVAARVDNQSTSAVTFPKHLRGPQEEAKDHGLKLQLELNDSVALGNFLGLDPSMSINGLRGDLNVFTDNDFKRLRLSFENLQAEMAMDEHILRATDLSGFYRDGLYLSEGELEADAISAKVVPTRRGFEVKTSIGAEDLDLWVSGIAGPGTFDLDLDWINGIGGDFMIFLKGQQRRGPLVYLDPWLAFEDLILDASYHPSSGLEITKAAGMLNDGQIELDGSLRPIDDTNELLLNAFANEVNLDLGDMQSIVTTALEWRAGPDENVLRANIIVNEGYLASDVEIKGLVTDFLDAVPELYFPNPTLEQIQLEAFVATQKPLIVEHDIAYLELEVPWLKIEGNMAAPLPKEGFVNINRGSSLDLGNQGFVFRDSQIQFLSNRPNDPYLLVSLESPDDFNKNSINLNGFVSELGNNMETDNLTNILANYLVGQVSSMVSLESGQGKTLFDDSFTFVVSKPLTRKLVTRYAIPVSEGRSEQRFEISMGPYWNNFFNVARRGEVLRGDVQHSLKFGWPNGEKPPKIRRVVFPKDTPRWVKRKFKLKKDQLYTETQWRRAMLDLHRRYKERGFLAPSVEHTWEKRVLRVTPEAGPQTKLVVEGLDLSDDERRRLLRSIRSLDETGMRQLGAQAERMALSKGYPSAAAFASLEEDTLKIDILLSQRLGHVNLDFGPGNELLQPLYSDKQQKEAFIRSYLLDDEAVKTQVRARLAAMGYVDPKISNGNFIDFDLFQLKVTPGRHGDLIAIRENGNDLESPYIGDKFHYGLIDKIATEMQSDAGRKTLVRIKPRRVEHNVVLDVERTPIEETLIQTLSVTGNERLSEKTISRFLGFKPGMSQQELVDSQRRLIASGALVSARLRAEEDATLEVIERNRYDADFLISWDEENEFGHAIQFNDHQIFRGINNLGMRVEQSKQADAFVGRLTFQRVRGTPLDISVGLNWRGENEDPEPLAPEDFGLFVEQQDRRTETREVYLEFTYPFRKYQQFGVGFSHEKIISRNYVTTTSDIFDDSFELRRNDTQNSPIRLSWIYRRLDYPTAPRNGVLATIGADLFTKIGSDPTTFEGARYSASVSTFKTWNRWLWTSRVEAGIFSKDVENNDSNIDPATSIHFTLGGSTSIRGYDQYLVGPLQVEAFDVFDDEFNYLGEDFTVRPLGGDAEFFFSQEMTYTTKYFGLGVTPFIDGGWVWEDPGEFMRHGIVISGGLGLSLDTPVGYFRIDWANPISEKPIERILDEVIFFEPDTRKRLEGRIHNDFYFRFGRVF